MKQGRFSHATATVDNDHLEDARLIGTIELTEFSFAPNEQKGPPT